VAATLLVLAGFALVAALLAWSRWLAGRRWAAVGHLALAIVAASFAAAGWPISRDLATLQPLRPDQAVAELFFEQAGAHRFRATLTRLPSGRMQVFELDGDEWRLTARGLEWTPRFATLGLGPLYQLEQLEGRPALGGDETASPARFVLHPVTDTDPWSQIAAGSWWSAAARPLTLDGPWQPMAHRQRFLVRLDGTTALSVSPGRAAVAEQAGMNR
jgi:hypothetical protein